MEMNKTKILWVIIALFVSIFLIDLINNINYNDLFHQCAEFLRIQAPKFGMTYKEINIWIFVIIEPIIFILMVLWIIRLKIRIKKLQK